MKTPEEYLPRSEPTLRKFKDGTEYIIYVPRYVAINSLKSMREDHEKELIEYIQFSAWMEIGEEKLEWLMMTSQQRLTQFRNKQQHHDTTH